MGKIENTGIWEKIQKSVQETERLMGQKKYNLSMIKARQTLEYMVKLHCDKAGIVESTPETMIRELYDGKWITKSTAEHYLQVLSIGNKATKEGDNSAYNANQAYHILSQEIYSFVDADKAPKVRRTSSQKTQAQNKSRKRQSSSKKAASPTDLLKLAIPIVLVIILIALITLLSGGKEETEETTTPAATTEAPATEAPETEAPTEAAPVVYKTTTTLNVRSGPGTENDRIGKLDPDSTVDFIRDHNEEWAVILYNEQEAYVAKEYLTIAE